jgi:hypothetical protein
MQDALRAWEQRRGLIVTLEELIGAVAVVE